MKGAEQDGRSDVAAREGLLRLPFDLYGRYRMVADALERLREGSKPLRVLDADTEGVLPEFLPGDQVTVLGSDSGATALPFEDEAFDYVVGGDAYGRFGPEDREKHLSELRRAAYGGVLLAATFDSVAVRGARRVAGDFLRAARAGHPEQDASPQGYGLPDLGVARRLFEQNGDTVHVLPNGYVPHWLAMTCLAAYAAEPDGGTGSVLDGVNAFYNECLYGSDNVEPSYRHLLVSLKVPVGVDLGGLASPELGPVHASSSSALFGALAAVVPLAVEVRRANEGLVRKEGELARKEAKANDLSRRLAERITADNLRQAQAINKLRLERDRLQRDNNRLRRNRDDLQRQFAAVTGTRAWRALTALRRIRLKLTGSG